MSQELLMYSILVLVGVQFITIQLGFRLLKHYIREISKAEQIAKSERERYERLAEIRDLTKVESIMNTFQGRNEVMQQELLGAFNTMRTLLDKHDVLSNTKLGEMPTNHKKNDSLEIF